MNALKTNILAVVTASILVIAGCSDSGTSTNTSEPTSSTSHQYMNLYVVDTNGNRPLLFSQATFNLSNIYDDKVDRPAGWKFGCQGFMSHEGDHNHCFDTYAKESRVPKGIAGTNEDLYCDPIEFKADASRHGSSDTADWFKYRALGDMSGSEETPLPDQPTSHALGLNIKQDQSGKTYFPTDKTNIAFGYDFVMYIKDNTADPKPEYTITISCPSLIFAQTHEPNGTPYDLVAEELGKAGYSLAQQDWLGVIKGLGGAIEDIFLHGSNNWWASQSGFGDDNQVYKTSTDSPSGNFPSLVVHCTIACLSGDTTSQESKFAGKLYQYETSGNKFELAFSIDFTDFADNTDQFCTDGLDKHF